MNDFIEIRLVTSFLVCVLFHKIGLIIDTCHEGCDEIDEMVNH